MSTVSVVAWLVDVIMVKATLLVLVGALLAALVRRSSSGVAAVWFVTLGALVLLPVATGLLPAWDVATIEFPHALLPSPWMPLALWGAGAMRGLLHIVVDARAARRIARAARPASDGATRRHVERSLRPILSATTRVRIDVRTTTALVSPAITGWRRPTLLLPAGIAEWPSRDLQAAMRHEGAHLLRGDWAVGMLESIVGALCWINPAVRWAFRQSAEHREMAADNAALAHRGDPSTYAAVLLRVARLGAAVDPDSRGTMRRAGAPVSASMVGFGLRHGGARALESRIRALFDPSRDRRDRRVATARRAIPLFALLVPVLASATLWVCLP